MAIDFGKYGAPVATTKTGQPVDFSKYGTTTETIQTQSTQPQTSKFNVPETQQAKIQRYQAEAQVASQDAEKANSFVEKYLKPTLGTLFPSAAALGETVGGIINANTLTNDYQKRLQTLDDVQFALVKQINKDTVAGKDTTKLKQLYNQGVESRQRIVDQYNKDTAGAQKTNAQVAGELGGTALDILTAGTYGAAAKGMQAGKLASEVPTVAKAAVNVVTNPSSIFSRAGALKAAEGAGIGYGYDVTNNLAGGKTGLEAATPGLGTAIGAGIPLVTGAAKSVKNLAGKFSENSVRQELGNTIRDTAQKYTRAGTLLDVAEKQHGTDPIGVLQTYGGKTVPTLTKSGSLNPAESIDFLKKKIGELSNLKNEGLFLSDQKIGLPEYRSFANDLIDGQNWSESKKVAVARDVNKIIDNIEAGYKNSPKNNGGLELSELDKIKTEQTAKSKTYNNPNSPFEYDAHAVAGKAARTLIEMFSNDTGTKELNKFIQSHYDAIDLLQSLKGKKPNGGALSKMFYKLGGDVVGAVAGHAVGHPIIGAAVGRGVSSKIVDILQSNYIANPIKRMLIDNLKEQSPKEVTNAMKALESKYADAFAELGLGQKSILNTNSATSKPIANNITPNNSIIPSTVARETTTGNPTPLATELSAAQVHYNAAKDALDSNPAKALSKYASKDGIPEVTGRGNGKFGVFGDDIANQLGYTDSESARLAYDKYLKQKKQVAELSSNIKRLKAEMKGQKNIDATLPKEPYTAQDMAAFNSQEGKANTKMIIGLGTASAAGTAAGALVPGSTTTTVAPETPATQSVQPKGNPGEVIKIDKNTEARIPTTEYQSAIDKAYTSNPNLPKGIIEAVLMQESSMGGNSSNKNDKIGAYAWLGGLTNAAKKDLQRLGKSPDFNSVDGAIQAIADFLTVKSSSAASSSPVDIYRRYASQMKKNSPVFEKFNKLVNFYQ